MAERPGLKLPSSTPLLSWFEFLLDKSGDLLKNHLKNDNPDPPPFQLCGSFLEKSLAPQPSCQPQGNKDEIKPLENKRIRQLRYLALVVASYLKWNLDAIQESLTLHFQHMLLMELVRNYGINETDTTEDFHSTSLDKRTILAWVLFHRWVVKTVVKARLSQTQPKPAFWNNRFRDKELQEESIMQKLQELLPTSTDILEKATLIVRDLEIPFPRPIQHISTQYPQPDDSNKLDGESKVVSSEDDDEVMNIMQKDSLDVVKNPYEEIIPVPTTQMLIEVCNDLGIMYFFQENYKGAYSKFKKIFGILEVNKDYRSSVDLTTLKGFYSAAASISKLPISLPMSLQGKGDSISKVEKSIANNFEGLFQLLKEDNISRELPIGYRLDLEIKVLLKVKKKDLVFKICACNAVRECLEGRIISLNFLHSLKSASRAETSTLQELIVDVILKSKDSSVQKSLERLFRIVMPFFSKDNKERFASDTRLNDFFDKQPHIEEKRTKMDSSLAEGEMIELSPQLSSSVFEGCPSVNLDEEPAYLRRRLAITNDAEQIKQIVTQLNSVSQGKVFNKGFECPMYDDLLTEMRDPVIFNTLHVFLQKSQLLVEQKEFRKALSLLSNSLDLLNQYSLKSSPGPHVGRIKNILHHELLATEIQFQSSIQDGSMNADVIRRCKACYHHRNQDPKPKKHIYQNMVACLLNSREMQFLLDEGPNYEGVADFREIGYNLAHVAIGISRVADSVRIDGMGLWNSLLKIFTESQQLRLQQQSAYERSTKSSRTVMATISRIDFVEFVKSIKEGVVLPILASCFSTMLTLIKKDPEKELKPLYNHLWPSDFDSNVLEPREEDILYILHPLMDCIIDIDPQNIAWLKNSADLHFVQEQYSEAMRVYLEVGALTSAVFSVPVPYNAWDEQVYRRLIRCCQKMKASTQVAILCQFLDPVDYTTAFKAIQENKSDDAVDSLYEFFWDITIIEFLVYANSKRGDEDKKQLAVKTISQPELNSCNSPDTLRQSADLRKTKFLRSMAKLYWK